MVERSSFLDRVDGSSNPLMSALYMNKQAGDLVNAYHQVVMRGESGLDPKLRESIAALVSGLNMCPLCHTAHSRVSELLGYDREKISAARLEIESSGIDEKEQPLFSYAKKLTLSPSTLTYKDAEEVFLAGWTEQDLHDMVNIVSLFNFINRFVLGHGIKVKPEAIELSANVLAKVGYWDVEKNAPPPGA